MILERFKLKSIQKNMDRMLKARAYTDDVGKINRIGIILNFYEYHDYERIRSLFRNMGFKESQLSFIAFINIIYINSDNMV